MLDYIDEAEARGVKVAGVWIQDWAGRITTSFGSRLFWDWHWSDQQYPGKLKSFAQIYFCKSVLSILCLHFFYLTPGDPN
jgi:hypothetical protein